MKTSPVPPLSRLLALGLLAAVAPLAQAQVGSQLITCVENDEDIDLLAALLGAKVIDAIPEQRAYLLEIPGSLSSPLLDSFASVIQSFDGALLVENNHEAKSPESDHCELAAPATVQQCTIGFVDGDPSKDKYIDQDWIELLGIGEARALSKGTHGIVAVIDTGVDLAHPDLKKRLFTAGYDVITDQWGGWEVANGLDDDGDGLVDEAFGHGTHLAGTIALIDPDALILSLRAMDSDGNGKAFDIAKAIWIAIDLGADVINLSLSLSQPSELVLAALGDAVEAGVDVYTSAGNTGKNKVLFPASLEPGDISSSLAHPVLAVGATGANDEKASFSAWGASIDVMAPGVDIYGPYPGGGYAWWSGTSMSTAIASGVGSLLRSVDGTGLEWYEVVFFLVFGWKTELDALPGGFVECLLATTVSIDEMNPAYAGGLGSGRIDALAAASNVAPEEPEPDAGEDGDQD